MMCGPWSKTVASDELESLCEQLLVACVKVLSLHLPCRDRGEMMNLSLDNQSVD